MELLRKPVPTLRDLSAEGKQGMYISEERQPDEEEVKLLGELYREDLDLPQLTVLDVVRHFTNLSHRNWAVDLGPYPLGSCTMKYNPRLPERFTSLPEITGLHPLQPTSTVQPVLQILYELKQKLAYLTGMDEFSLQPAAGAHGEYTAMLIVKAYFRDRGELRDTILVPDSAHGTNPASAAMAGFKVVTVKSDERGNVDIRDLKAKLNERTAAIMLTNPNTLGLFEEQISEIIELVNSVGALAYYDGANFNAIMGLIRPGDMGFHIVHLNLHKTFSTPHGSGGPGAGPIGVKAFLADYLPVPVLKSDGINVYWAWDLPKSIGKVKDFYGNISVLLKAYCYITLMGSRLKDVAKYSVLSANYLRAKISEILRVPFNRLCKHEFVASASEWKKKYGLKAMDIAKRMLDYGVHAPTVYFPLIVEEAMMFEPTETESKRDLDLIVETLRKIKEEAEREPEVIKTAPHNLPVRRVNEALATRKPQVKW